MDYSKKYVFVRKRNNKFSVTIQYESENGKTKQKTVEIFDNKKDAEKLKVKIQNEINEEKFIAPTSTTFVEKCKEYYLDPIRELSPNTKRRWDSIIRIHIEPFFKDTLLEDITINKYKSFIRHIYSLNLADGTKEEILNKSNAALKDAYLCKEIKENISVFAFATTKNKKKIEKNMLDEENMYNQDEIKLILKKAESRYNLHLALSTYIYTGARFGEMAGLLWDDVDFKNKTITIQHNLQYISGKYILGPPKNYMIRTISIPDVLVELYKKESIKQKELKLLGLLNKDFNFVHLNAHHKRWNSSSFCASYKRLIEDIGNLRYISAHNFRHAHATLLLASGVDINTVSKRLGHKDINTTSKYYTHILKKADENAANKIELII